MTKEVSLSLLPCVQSYRNKKSVYFSIFIACGPVGTKCL